MSSYTPNSVTDDESCAMSISSASDTSTDTDSSSMSISSASDEYVVPSYKIILQVASIDHQHVFTSTYCEGITDVNAANNAAFQVAKGYMRDGWIVQVLDVAAAGMTFAVTDLYNRSYAWVWARVVEGE
jgi:hypothetical protein